MALNVPLDLASRPYNFAGTAEKQSGSRQYDSFIVRLWKDEESDSMLRVELQHVQAGLSIEAMEVPLDWIVPKIMDCMQSPESSTGDEVAGSESAQ